MNLTELRKQKTLKATRQALQGLEDNDNIIKSILENNPDVKPEHVTEELNCFKIQTPDMNYAHTVMKYKYPRILNGVLTFRAGGDYTFTFDYNGKNETFHGEKLKAADITDNKLIVNGYDGAFIWEYIFN